MILRHRYPELPRPYRTPWYPVVPLLFILAMLLLVSTIIVTKPREALMGVATIVTGMVAYRLFFTPAVSG